LLQVATFLYAGTRKYFRRMALAAGAGAALLLTGNAASAADEIFAARDSITLPGGQLITVL
jgi:hypothetical protein